MRYVCKCTNNRTKIVAKKMLGFDKCEIQLFSDFIINGVANPGDYCDNVLNEGFDVVSVHSPLCKEDELFIYGCPQLIDLLHPERFIVMENTFKVAQYCADICQHPVKAVFHNSETFYCLETTGALNNVVGILNELFIKYPSVIFEIENVTPVADDKFISGNFEECASIIKYLSQYFGESVKIVIDTCHALSTTRMAKRLERYNLPDVEDIFTYGGAYCGTVHLANCKEYGYENGQHGTGFMIHDKLLCKKLLRYIQENCPNADIVLEIQEADYIENANVKDTLETLKIIEGDI